MILLMTDELSRRVKGFCFIRSYVRSCIRWPYVFFSKTAYDLSTQGANSMRDNFSIVPNHSLGPQKCKTSSSSKINSIVFFKKCMVSMATVNAILEDGGIYTKLIISPLLLILDY